jgi:hypothetical protein
LPCFMELHFNPAALHTGRPLTAEREYRQRKGSPQHCSAFRHLSTGPRYTFRDFDRLPFSIMKLQVVPEPVCRKCAVRVLPEWAGTVPGGGVLA